MLEGGWESEKRRYIVICRFVHERIEDGEDRRVRHRNGTRSEISSIRSRQPFGTIGQPGEIWVN